MHNYEIHIRRHGTSLIVLASVHTGDYAAVRRARSLRAAAESVQVWRDGDCVYSSAAGERPPLHQVQPPFG